jgi:glyoxylase-like metal-dependent hydrolase (beta-lactamase superfamily II)
MPHAVLVALAAVLVVVQAPPPAPAAPPPREIAKDTVLLPGAMLPERGPDGNTVVFSGPDGLVVVDTGRHRWHSDGILAFARSRQKPIVAIVNTHWHLDHSSGNGRVKAEHAGARVYTTTAVDRVLAADGFLARNLTGATAQAENATVSATRREETAIFIATMASSETLRPDVPVERSGTLRLAGRPLSVRVATDAVTDADVWLYDEATRVAVLGDLVTLPAPFFETACPGRWQTALDEVWATPFQLAVPGHGEPMSRAQFDTYRQAFAAFRACVASDAAPAACAGGWTTGVASLLATDADRKQATGYAAYYVDFLRKNGGASPDCRAQVSLIGANGNTQTGAT